MSIENTPIADEAPWSDEVNAYDAAQLALYLRLLDAIAAQAPEAEICEVLFGINAEREPARAQKCLQSHLKRARWMTRYGYRQLIDRESSPSDGAKSDAKH